MWLGIVGVDCYSVAFDTVDCNSGGWVNSSENHHLELISQQLE